MLRNFGIEFEYLPSDYPDTAADVISRRMFNFVRERPARFRGRGASFYAHRECGNLVEIKTPVMTQRDWPLVHNMVTTIVASGGRFDGNAGTHMHLDRRYISANDQQYYSARWALVWASVESYLEELVMPYRRNNRWCTRARFGINMRRLKEQLLAVTPSSPMPHITFDYGGSACRFFTGHTSTEIRLHHCTLDYTECRSWIALMNVLLDFSDNASNDELANLRRFRPGRARRLVHRMIHTYTTPARSRWLYNQLQRREIQYSNPVQLSR